VTCRRSRTAAILTACALASVVVSAQPIQAAANIGPAASLHYVPNGEQFAGDHAFKPGAHGFNVADIGVDDTSKLGWLKGSTKALLWVGSCGGATATFKARVTRAIRAPGHTRILAFYLMDEPDPTGIWHGKCTAAHLKAQSEYVHSRGYKTFITLMLMSSANDRTLSFSPGYNYGNSRVDYYGVSAYPCRTNNGTSGRCDMREVKLTVAGAAKQLGGKGRIVPIYQAFGGGSWVPEGDGKFTVPTAAEVRGQLAAWRRELPAVPFDMAYSWGTQAGDTALESPAGAGMLSAFAEHNH
jgi:hypothetical protein